MERTISGRSLTGAPTTLAGCPAIFGPRRREEAIDRSRSRVHAHLKAFRDWPHSVTSGEPKVLDVRSMPPARIGAYNNMRRMCARRRGADIPVCWFTGLSSPVFQPATGKSPEPADRNVCATPRSIAQFVTGSKFQAGQLMCCRASRQTGPSSLRFGVVARAGIQRCRLLFSCHCDWMR